MSTEERTRIRVDWEELEEAFGDVSADHRYYLDRETGAVHFFSSYLDNEEEEEDERSITSKERYVRIPPAERTAPNDDDLEDFVSYLGDREEGRRLRGRLEAGGEEGPRRAREALERMPAVLGQWRRFRRERLDRRIKKWLSEVGVEPL